MVYLHSGLLFALLGFLPVAQGNPSVLSFSPEEVPGFQDRGSHGTVEWEQSESPSIRIIPPSEGRNYSETRIPNQHSIHKGDQYTIRYELRAVSPTGGDPGQIGAEVTLGEIASSGRIEREQISRQTINLTSGEWTLFEFPWKAEGDYSPGSFRIVFRPRYFREILEIRNLTMVRSEETSSLPDRRGFSYPGQEPDADWRKKAEERIRKHRMADLEILVTDHKGNPLPNAVVKVDMLRHDYLFGTCVKASRIADAKIQSRSDDFDYNLFLEDNQRYREELKRLFNFAVFENDMKWPNWAGRRNDRGWSQRVTMDAVRWLQENDFQIKSHTMLWGSWRQSPDYLKAFEENPERLNQLIDLHLIDQAQAFKDQVQYTDVLNEALSHNDLIEVVGWDRIDDWFRTVKEQMPDTQLVINEFDILGNGGSPKRQLRHENLITEILENGGKIDVLGFQSHFWSTRLTPPEELFRIIDRFSAFGLPLMVSEFDMNILDEQLQADYTRDFLKAWFSHPATEAFIMWGFWGKAHWFGEPGAMFRNDWSPKPNLESYQDLVFNEWWSQESLVTNKVGQATFRIFKGDYSMEISAPGYHTSSRHFHQSSDAKMFVILYPQDTMPETR